MKLTYASAADWAAREPSPDPTELEVYAAQRDLAIVDTLKGYTSSASAEESQRQRKRGGNRGFAYALEEWILPCIGGAGLLFGMLMLSPQTFFGDSISYWGGGGKRFEIDTVGYSNVDTRIVLATIMSMLGLVLLAGNAIARTISKNARLETSVMSLIMMAISAVSILYITVISNEGFDGFAVPLAAHIGVLIAGVANIVLYQVHKRRRHPSNDDAEQAQPRQLQQHLAQRYAAANAQFAQLPPARQQEILTDRAQAVNVLVARGVLHPKVEQDLGHLRFGDLTAALTSARTDARASA